RGVVRHGNPLRPARRHMAIFLFKTEPSEYSYADLARDRRTVWEGVSNALALKHLRSVAKGDTVVIYHTGCEKSVVGIAKAVSGPGVGDAAHPGTSRADREAVERVARRENPGTRGGPASLQRNPLPNAPRGAAKGFRRRITGAPGHLKNRGRRREDAGLVTFRA